MESQNIHKQIRDSLRKASFQISMKKYADVISALEPFLEFLRGSEFKNDLCQTSGNLGICYYELGELGKARAYFEEALDLARANEDQRTIAITLHELSLVLWKEGKLKEAISMCQDALDLELDQGSEGTLELHTISILYQENRQFDEALKILEIVKESCEARHDLSGLGKTLNELGLVHTELGDIAKAVSHFSESINLKRRIGDTHGIGTTLNNLSSCLRSHPEAFSNPEVRRILDDLRDKYGLAF